MFEGNANPQLDISRLSSHFSLQVFIDFYRLRSKFLLGISLPTREFDMPRGVQAGTVQAEQIMDLTAEPDEATEDDESGTLQDGVLDDDDDEEAEAGKSISPSISVPYCYSHLCCFKFLLKHCFFNFVPSLACV
jgi:hypothetical protein